MKRFRQESFGEKAYRYRGVVLVISVPLLLIVFVLLAMPRHSVDPSTLPSLDPFHHSSLRVPHKPSSSSGSASNTKYAVVFDAGSSGSRVHVYCFGDNLELVPIGGEMELFRQRKGGLSSFSGNPEAGVDSLRPLLHDAIGAVPSKQRSKTPVRVGATAGLRTLPGSAAQNLLDAVTTFLADSPFKFQSDWVSILDGTQEGAYAWVTINYLLGNLGQDYGETVGVVDLGGGSVQMAYAISEEAAKHAPKASAEGEHVYVKELSLLGKVYYLYVHSYLHYGLLAARAEVLKLVDGQESCPCLAGGFEGKYKYGSENFRAFGSASGADFHKCQKLLVKALNKEHACEHMQCTFGGIWSGGGGDGQKKLFVASFFFDRALQANIIDDPNAVEAKLRPADFARAANQVCASSVDDIAKQYPSTDENDRPYFCLDLMYQFVLLVDGFAIEKEQEITLIKKVKYKDDFVEAAWPLGNAIEAISMK